MCGQHIRALFSSVCFQAWVAIKKDMHFLVFTVLDAVERSCRMFILEILKCRCTFDQFEPMAFVLQEQYTTRASINSTSYRKCCCKIFGLLRSVVAQTNGSKTPFEINVLNKARKPELWVTRPSRDKHNYKSIYKSIFLGVLILNVWVI